MNITELEDRQIGPYRANVHHCDETGYFRAELSTGGRVIASFDVTTPSDGWAAIGREVKRLSDRNGWQPACMHRNGNGQ